MMMLSILSVERFMAGIPRKVALFFLGVLFISFHLINGVYYRFFNCMIPPDIFKQWSDLLVIHNEGVGLISIREFVVILFAPLILLVFLLLRHARAKRTVFIVLLIMIGTGWGYRLIRMIKIKYEVQEISKVAALPSFIYRAGHLSLTFGFSGKRYRDIIQNIDTVIPRCLNGYRLVPNKGVIVEPADSNSNSDSRKYNVILILLESVRAYECGFLGSYPSFTPYLDELTKEAKVYDNFYANGNQTVRGEFSTLCSIYPNPFGVPTYLINPSLHVISLPQILQKAGYNTLWFSAYTADFHNKRAFLRRHGINEIIDRDVLPERCEPAIGWGMNDEEMFRHVWEIIKDANEPFFAQITTLSNHHVKGRQYPMERKAPMIDASSEYQQHVRGVYYTDYAVSRFITSLLQSELGKNTILIVTSDHGLWIFPNDISDPLQKQEIFFRMPLCVWGPTDIIEPGIDHTLGSQVDIAPTVLDMLNIYHANTFLGQSLVNNSISQKKRHVVSYLGSKLSVRIGDIFMISDEDFQNQEIDSKGVINPKETNPSQKAVHKFALIEGDTLRGNYTIMSLLDNSKAVSLSNRVDDLTFLIGYAIYHDSFMGSLDSEN
jgi:glucan phosphoethanolaminetransferase (alkaline phosphatase superfamily)